MIDWKNISAGTISRTILLFLALVNQFLVVSGHSPLPIDDAAIEGFISTIFLAATALAAWWKDNDFTKKAIERKKMGEFVSKI